VTSAGYYPTTAMTSSQTMPVSTGTEIPFGLRDSSSFFLQRQSVHCPEHPH
jgi:hypothetical protein